MCGLSKTELRLQTEKRERLWEEERSVVVTNKITLLHNVGENEKNSKNNDVCCLSNGRSFLQPCKLVLKDL